MSKELENLLFILQLEEYDTRRFLDWAKTHDILQIKQEKKQLVWTFKARVIYLLSYLPTVLGVRPLKSLILITKILLLPENVIKKLIILLAKIKLLFYPKLMVIGITGSYGKTSVKEILNHLLESDYQVLKTPESYNTPLGIAKIILFQLNRRHKIFIVEMGAYHIGDIKNMCRFVHPKFGILTAIGKQHLERFGSQENIIKAKSELLESLPSNGFAIINGDNHYCLEVARKQKTDKILYATHSQTNLKLKNENIKFLTALNIKSGQSGSSFEIRNGGEVLSFQTKLLGVHNISNILAAICLGRELNISWDKIKTSVSTIPAIPHRLQVISGANNTTVIDDAYNANPDSVRAALEVLKSFVSKRKIVVTPGLVELGSQQEKENEIMGQEIAKVADYLIVVGETNKNALKNGFFSVTNNKYSSSEARSSRPAIRLGGDYPLTPRDNSSKKVVFSCQNLREATTKLQEIIIPQTVILFENDLPDQYI